MGAHGCHDNLPGFDPQQIWHDGCAECEWRGEHLRIDALDSTRFERAWERATQLGRHGLPTCSRAEKPLLDALWSIQVQLERRGWPLGVIPTANTVSI